MSPPESSAWLLVASCVVVCIQRICSCSGSAASYRSASLSNIVQRTSWHQQCGTHHAQVNKHVLQWLVPVPLPQGDGVPSRFHADLGAHRGYAPDIWICVYICIMSQLTWQATQVPFSSADKAICLYLSCHDQECRIVTHLQHVIEESASKQGQQHASTCHDQFAQE